MRIRRSGRVPRRWVRRWMLWAALFPVYLAKHAAGSLRHAAEDVRDDIRDLDWDRQD